MPSKCIISFKENPAGVYFSGQIFSGRVCLTTDSVKAIRGIYITIDGHSRVRWTESRGGGRTRRTTTYYAREEYLKSRVDVLRDPSADRFDLPSGKNEFDYKIMLPPDLPSSFNSHYGVTKYQVVCTIERPWKFDNVFKHTFTVIRHLDLNLQQIYQQPVERQTTKSFSKVLCCGDGGEIFVKGNLPCGGFVPGQSLPVSVRINNKSKISTYETNACLVQMVEYRSHSPYQKSKYEHRTVTLNLFGPLKEHQNKDLHCTLYIPAVAPSSFISSAIIEVSYFVEIQLKTRGIHRSMNVRLPITIGTVPYGFNPYTVQGNNPSTSNEAPDSQDLPTYEEAVNLGPNFTHEADDDKFAQEVESAPRYPVYKNITIPTFPPNLTDSIVTTQPGESKEKF